MLEGIVEPTGLLRYSFPSHSLRPLSCLNAHAFLQTLAGEDYLKGVGKRFGTTPGQQITRAAMLHHGRESPHSGCNHRSPAGKCFQCNQTEALVIRRDCTHVGGIIVEGEGDCGPRYPQIRGYALFPTPLPTLSGSLPLSRLLHHRQLQGPSEGLLAPL